MLLLLTLPHKLCCAYAKADILAAHKPQCLHIEVDVNSLCEVAVKDRSRLCTHCQCCHSCFDYCDVSLNTAVVVSVGFWWAASKGAKDLQCGFHIVVLCFMSWQKLKLSASKSLLAGRLTVW